MKIFKMLYCFVFTLFTLTVSSAFAGFLTLPFDGDYPVRYSFDHDPNKDVVIGCYEMRAKDNHKGTDYGTSDGTSVLAMADGDVIDARDNRRFEYYNERTEYYENTYKLYNVTLKDVPDTDIQKRNARRFGGNIVKIRHYDAHDTQTWYLHLKKNSIVVKAGQLR